MENINAEFPLEIWENGQPNENFEVEADDEEEGAREDNGSLDGGVAGGDETGEKRRSADCDLVGLCRIWYTFYVRLVLTFVLLLIAALVFTVRRSTQCSSFSCNPPSWSGCFYWT
jgi:hypothetical protein